LNRTNNINKGVNGSYTAVWCVVAYYLVSHPVIATRLHKTRHKLFPFILIGLGIYILTSVLYSRPSI